jgi:4-hydroxybenzoate polyprenyltransferase
VTDAHTTLKTAVKVLLGVALLLVLVGVFTVYFDNLLFGGLLAVLLAVGWLYRRYKRADTTDQSKLEDYETADK